MGGCRSATALSDVSLLRYTAGLVSGLVGAPLVAACRYRLLSRCGRRRGSRGRRCSRCCRGLVRGRAAATLSNIGLFRNAVGPISSLVCLPLIATSPGSLLSRWGCCCGSRSRWGSGCCRRLGRRRATAALSDVGLFRYAIGLVGGLVGPPLVPACRCRLLLRYGVRSQRQKSEHCREHGRRDLPFHLLSSLLNQAPSGDGLVDRSGYCRKSRGLPTAGIAPQQDT